MSERLSQNNNTISFEELVRLFEKLKAENKPVITLKDAVLMLLYAQKNKPIYGRILLFKEVFLLYEEILKKYREHFILENPRYEPYKYGPYSFRLADLLEQLYWAGFIEIIGKRNTRLEAFIITDKGIKEIERKFETLLPELREEITKKRQGWDQLGIDGILRYVYQKYPQYKINSKIKDKYKEIMWGGKG